VRYASPIGQKNKNKKGDLPCIEKSRFKHKRFIRQFPSYNLRVEKHFVHNVFSQGREGYGVGGIGEILNQVLMIFRTVGRWKTMGKKSKLGARVSLRSN